MSNTTNIVNKSSPRESETGCSKKPPFLAISTHSSVTGTPQAIRDWLMSSQRDFPANHSVLLAKGSEKPTHAISGLKHSNAFAWLDRDSHTWKTFQACLLTTTHEPFLDSWPKQGLMRDGVCWEQMIVAPRTGENVCGFIAPTPNTMDHLAPRSQEGIARQFAGARKGRTTPANLREWIHPQMWPTPRANDAEKRGNIANDVRNGLPAAAKHWPTPNASDGKGGPGSSANKQGGMNLRTAAALTNGDGQLNPAWVEWLMGWPIGWTDLKPLEMDRFLEWLKQHGEC